MFYRIQFLYLRYSCITPEFVTRPPANYTSPPPLWMVTQCDHGNDQATKEMCENVKTPTPLEYTIPVTDLETGVIYRNTFCAKCNGIVNKNLLLWDMSIECDESLQLPDRNIITQMEGQNCSAVFEPLINEAVFKHGLKAHMISFCDAFEYTISICNVTGLWPVFNTTTDAACNSFIDPFNRTYKNYFCYVCNVEHPLSIDQLFCKYTGEGNIDRVTPAFNAVLDINTIRRWEAGDTLTCDKDTQYEDYKLVSLFDLILYVLVNNYNSVMRGRVLLRIWTSIIQPVNSCEKCQHGKCSKMTKVANTGICE